MNNKKNSFVAIIDYGSQYTQLITRRVRANNVYSEIFSHKKSLRSILDKKPDALILSGGPSSVYDDYAPSIDKGIYTANVPVLGICYGMQLLIQKSGGIIASSTNREYGSTEIRHINKSKLMDGINQKFNVWMSHGDKIKNLNNNWNIISKSKNNIISAVEYKHKKIFGVQFHPEVIHTDNGNQIIKNFLFKISNCNKSWNSKNFINNIINDIRMEVGDENVICGISGGVDSSVLAALLNKAIGNQMYCIFIDHGLLRKNEGNEVIDCLNKGLGVKINKIDKSTLFLKKLKNVTDPELKRKIIGESFIRSFEEALSKSKNYKFLAQGTLYPDVIESGFSEVGMAAKIKSHHNVGGIPDDNKFKLLEPLKDLFKDEVRAVGKELGLPPEIINRHPFPGPGLGIRIIGKINKKRLKIIKEVDSIFIEELRKSGYYDKIWQAFSVLIPIKTVGVMGDSRTYDYLVSLRAVSSIDGMTADWFKMPPEILNICSNRIINEVNGVNRVVYDITSKPPSTIEWE